MPNFLCIGAMRAGSTLLYDLLKSHPDIYVPPYRKEVRYFDQNYDRGQSWYESFFEGADRQLVGEVTPTYLYSDEARHRIKEDIPDVKLLVILRDPVKRAYSNFKHAYLKKNTETESFKDFLEKRPDVWQRGQYYHYLNKWFEVFGKDAFCVLFLEDIDRASLKRLAQHLDVDEEGFDASVLTSSSHSSFVPISQSLYSAFNNAGKWLRKKGMDEVVETLRPVLDTILASDKDFPALQDSDRRQLQAYYKQDVEALETLLGRNLPFWL